MTRIEPEFEDRAPRESPSLFAQQIRQINARLGEVYAGFKRPALGRFDEIDEIDDGSDGLV